MKNFFAIIVLSLFFQPGLHAQNTAGDSIFAVNSIHTVYLNFTQTSFWDTLTHNYTLDVYTKCNMIADGVSYPNVGVELKGNSSYNNPSIKKSMKLKLDEYGGSLKWNDLKKFNLNNGFKDPTFMREKITLDFLNEIGAPAPRCTYAKVYLNNTYWGLYMFVEDVDKVFLDDRFGDKKGNMFKGDPHGDLRWYGPMDTSYYHRYELKTNETQNDWRDLVHLLDKINNTAPAVFHDSLEAVLNTTSAIRSWIGSNLFVNLDAYIGSGHNYYIYDDSNTHKFNWINWDVNEAFANFNMTMNLAQLENLSMFFISTPTSGRPLCEKMLADNTYKAQFITEYCNIISHFSNALLDTKIDSLKTLLMTEVNNDPNKYFTYQQFLDNISTDLSVPGNPGAPVIAGLKSFINTRRSFLLTELAANGCHPTEVKETIAPALISVYPNPTAQTCRISYNPGIECLALYNVVGEKILEMKNVNKNEVSINTQNLPVGAYLLTVNNTINYKLVVAH